MDELTTREKQAVILRVCYFNNKEIAEQMGIEVSTVKQYLHTATEKLHGNPALHPLSLDPSQESRK